MSATANNGNVYEIRTPLVRCSGMSSQTAGLVAGMLLDIVGAPVNIVLDRASAPIPHSPDPPREGPPELDEVDEKTNGRMNAKCPKCGKPCKNLAGVEIHIGKAHPP